MLNAICYIIFFPYYISNKNGDPLTMGGIYSSWKNSETDSKIYTVSIVTVPGNTIMSKIHNNPAVLKRIGPRMPMILPEAISQSWVSEQESEEMVKSLMVIYPDDQLSYHTVGQLQGKNGLGNVEQASAHFAYEYDDLP